MEKGGSEVDRGEEERDQRWMEERKRGIGGGRSGGNEGSGGWRRGRGRHQMLGRGVYTRMVEERMKDVSAQGKEKIDHVWMEEWTKWDQKDEGVGKMQ